MKPLRVREDVERQRERFSAACQSLRRGYAATGTCGSVSMRTGDALMITVAVAGAGDDGPVPPRQGVVLIDPVQGLPLLGETEWPPAETSGHLAIHRRLPDVAVVIHVPEASSVAPVADTLVTPLGDVTAEAPATLLRYRGGLFVRGRDLGEARRGLEELEALARPPSRPLSHPSCSPDGIHETEAVEVITR